MDDPQFSNVCRSIIDEISSVVIIDEEVLVKILTGFLADGHVLLEDVPGTGKTLTAQTLADVLGLSFSRVQFTPDLLPADITGTETFDEQSNSFEFRPGPLFANIVLADELNRASPKTQAALLEAMEERQVTVGGESYQLPSPFFVIGTQNPTESSGTFELPEAQKDRFMIKTTLGYPDADGELELIDRRANRRTRRERVERISDSLAIEQLRNAPEGVTVERTVRQYVVSIARETRTDDRVAIGVSPRGTQRLFEAARAYAALSGRDFVTPDEVKAVARPVLTHRIVLTSDARMSGVQKLDVVEDVIAEQPVPKLSSRSTH